MHHSNVVEGGFCSIIEAAKFLGISRASVYVLLDKGELASARFGRSRRIPRKGLIEYAERSLQSA
jgi:excisionase family DNA binding protein